MQQSSDKTLTILEYVRIILRRRLTLSKKRARAAEEISGVNNQGRNRACFVNLSDLGGWGEPRRMQLSKTRGTTVTVLAIRLNG